MKRTPQVRAAFTLLEIMLVVLIIGLLIGMAIKFTAGHLGVAQETAVKGHIENYKTLLLMYQGSNGFLPTTEQGLKALMVKPEGEPRPRNWRQLIDQPILDPWQNEYFYVQPGKHHPDSYDIFSAGQDRKPDTADDIGNWDKAN
ncbi:MAG: ral secretion pathway protein [Chthoniobacter sp.]|jgi:general secretion pathway protein G|nr:ral secretion pathway protein [Chthoniobacter sp.]